jgi:type II secretory pathway pseudopilin PulG
MRARRGVSLFEAVAALAIVAVTTISALSTVGAELRAADRARRALEVEALLAERVSVLALLTERDLQRLPDSIADGRFPAPLDAYRWTTTSAPSTAYAGLYDVQVTLHWTDGARGDAATSVSTAQYRRPPLATRAGR